MDSVMFYCFFLVASKNIVRLLRLSDPLCNPLSWVFWISRNSLTCYY